MTIHVRLDTQKNAEWKRLAEQADRGPGTLARDVLEDVLRHAKIEGADYVLQDPAFALSGGGKRKYRDLHVVLRGREIEQVEEWMKYWHEPCINKCVRRMLLSFMNHAPVMDAGTVAELQDGISHLVKVGTNLNQIAHQINAQNWERQRGVDPAEVKQLKLQLDMTCRAINDFRRRARHVIFSSISGRRERPDV